MEITPQIKTCPKCGTEFKCFGEEDCWCETYQILQKDLIRITQEYSDCLCQDCLGEYASD
jgi:hypothetical protein